jgi:hypothetical protein
VKIAVFHPYTGQVAEKQSATRVIVAAERCGYEAREFGDDRDVIDYCPDYVLSFSHQCPKLTRFPTYGVINCPTSFLMETRRFIRNVLTFDAMLTMSPVVAEWYGHLCHGARKTPRVLDFTVTCNTVEDRDDIDFQNARVGYFGTNWDGQRLRDLFVPLSRTGLAEFYGPKERWSHVDQAAVRGVVDFDSTSVIGTYQKSGIGLCTFMPEFLKEQVPNNRIFEITASGAVCISSRHPLVERWFGDSVLYIDQEAPGGEAARQIVEHVKWVRANPKEAAAKARAAKRIFETTISMEKLLKDATEFHREILVAKRYVPVTRPASAPPPPRISVIVRTGNRPRAMVKRALDSIAAQTWPYVSVIVVFYRDDPELLELVGEYRDRLEIQILSCPGGNRSKTLWAGLRAVKTDYFAVLDDDDELYPNHFALLMDAFDYYRTIKGDGVKFIYAGSVQQSDQKNLWESWPDKHNIPGPQHMRLHCFEPLSQARMWRLMQGGNYLAVNSWVASSQLLDSEVLSDPVLNLAEDYYLVLCFLEKTDLHFNYEITTCFHVHGLGASGYAEPPDQSHWENVQIRMFGRRFRPLGEMALSINAPIAPDQGFEQRFKVLTHDIPVAVVGATTSEADQRYIGELGDKIARLETERTGLGETIRSLHAQRTRLNERIRGLERTLQGRHWRLLRDVLRPAWRLWIRPVVTRPLDRADLGAAMGAAALVLAAHLGFAIGGDWLRLIWLLPCAAAVGVLALRLVLVPYRRQSEDTARQYRRLEGERNALATRLASGMDPSLALGANGRAARSLADAEQPLAEHKALAHFDLLPFMRTNGAVVEDGVFLISAKDPRGIVLYGPYVNLAAGPYVVSFYLEIDDLTPSRAGYFRLDICSDDGGAVVFGPMTVDREDLKEAGALHRVDLEFTVPGGTTRYEFRLHHLGGRSLRIHAVICRPADGGVEAAEPARQLEPAGDGGALPLN